MSALLACSTFLGSFQRIAAHPSGEITEKTEYRIIANLSATPIAKAPPLPPSPITTDIMGTFILVNSKRFCNCLTLPSLLCSQPRVCPRGVNEKQHRNIELLCNLTPSMPSDTLQGFGIPKFRFSLCLVPRPFWSPIIIAFDHLYIQYNTKLQGPLERVYLPCIPSITPILWDRLFQTELLVPSAT